MAGDNVYLTVGGSIFDGIWNQIFCDRVHLFFVEPYILIFKVAFVVEFDLFGFCITIKGMVYSFHIGIKFVFRYTKGGGVHIGFAEVYQIGGEAYQSVHVLHGCKHIGLTFFT